jgi:hypothetical protein
MKQHIEEEQHMIHMEEHHIDIHTDMVDDIYK